MALRKVLTVVAKQGTKTAVVYRDAEWQEYRVKFWNENGTYQKTADYHCDTKEEAVEAANHYVS